MLPDELSAPRKQEQQNGTTDIICGLGRNAMSFGCQDERGFV